MPSNNGEVPLGNRPCRPEYTQKALERYESSINKICNWKTAATASRQTSLRGDAGAKERCKETQSDATLPRAGANEEAAQAPVQQASRGAGTSRPNQPTTPPLMARIATERRSPIFPHNGAIG